MARRPSASPPAVRLLAASCGNLKGGSGGPIVVLPEARVVGRRTSGGVGRAARIRRRGLGGWRLLEKAWSGSSWGGEVRARYGVVVVQLGAVGVRVAGVVWATSWVDLPGGSMTRVPW